MTIPRPSAERATPRGWGGHSMVAPLRKVLVRRPDSAFGAADPSRWHYAAQPNLAKAQAEHDALVGLLSSSGVEVVAYDQPLPQHADAIFVYDPVLMTDAGAVLLRMGKRLRQGEEAAMGEALERLGIPVAGRLGAPALAEGGDLLWLDRRTLAVGLGFRTNAEGARQLAHLLEPLAVDVVPVELPVYGGPRACLHLMSLISLVDDDLAVVYAPLLSVPFWQLLEQRGLELIEAPERELATQGTNVLAVGPRDCIVLAGNPETRGRLEAAGCRVRAYVGDEISLKAEGGPTCLTRPLWREVSA